MEGDPAEVVGCKRAKMTDAGTGAPAPMDDGLGTYDCRLPVKEMRKVVADPGAPDALRKESTPRRKMKLKRKSFLATPITKWLVPTPSSTPTTPKHPTQLQEASPAAEKRKEA